MQAVAAVARLSRPEATGLAVALLLVAVSRHYGWVPVPAEFRGVASKALGAAAALFLLSCVVLAWRDRLVTAAAAYYAFEESQGLGCSVWYMVAPFPVAPGQSLCSALVGFDLGAVGIALLGFTLWYILTPHSRGSKGTQ